MSRPPLQRPHFSSHYTTILTMVGVSIGLGNVWRFPYMMGQYGGSAFLFVYLIFTIVFAIPALMAEWALGRATRKGPIGAFTAVLNPTWGRLIGSLLLITVLVADSYYIVVIANVIFTAGYSIVYGFTADNIAHFQTTLNRGLLQYMVAVATLLVSLFVIYRGLNRGIEAVSKIFIPFFGLVIIYLVFSALTLEGAIGHFVAFLRPNWGAMQAEHIFAALGQTFFSLGLGATFLLTYGSYLQEDENIAGSAILTAVGDAGAALLASLFIIPAILVFGLDMTAGPQLIFSTLPNLFSVMPGGRLLGTAFLLALAMVAFLSNVAALEVLATGINDGREKPWSRNKIILAIGMLELVLMLPSALDPNLIGILDLVFGSGMQVFGGALAVLAVGWGFRKQEALMQIFAKTSVTGGGFFMFWLRWVIPSCLLYILISYIISSLGWG